MGRVLQPSTGEHPSLRFLPEGTGLLESLRITNLDVSLSSCEGMGRSLQRAKPTLEGCVSGRPLYSGPALHGPNSGVIKVTRTTGGSDAVMMYYTLEPSATLWSTRVEHV